MNLPCPCLISDSSSPFLLISLPECRPLSTTSKQWLSYMENWAASISYTNSDLKKKHLGLFTMHLDLLALKMASNSLPNVSHIPSQHTLHTVHNRILSQCHRHTVCQCSSTHVPCDNLYQLHSMPLINSTTTYRKAPGLAHHLVSQHYIY